MSKYGILFMLVLTALSVVTNAFTPQLPVSSPVTSDSRCTSLNVNIKVEVGDDGNFENAMHRFRKEVKSSGHLHELRRRRFFENSQQRRKRKMREAALRKKWDRLLRRRASRKKY